MRTTIVWRRLGDSVRSRTVLAVAILAVAATALACSSDSGNGASYQTPGQTAAPAATAPLSGGQGGGSSASSGQPNISSVVERIKPAVVQITSEQVQVDRFNQPFSVPAGVGSGVLYDSKGYILTNDHVVEGAQKLTVSLTDGRSMDATLVGADPRTDLAVLKVSGSNLPVAQLGDSSSLKSGDWVIAIGNALGLPGGPTVTVGVVSALHRTLQEPSSSSGAAGPFLFDLIQTDAAINPGNSGGPLVDLNARVVGINTLVAGEAEPGVPSQGIGFAIAISTAQPIAQQLVSNGQVQHPYIGISYVPLNAAVAAQLGTTVQQGAVVTEVAPGSPAAQAGLRANDIVTKVDGKDLADESALAAALASHKPGDKVTFTINRAGSTQDIAITLGTAPP